MEIGSNERLEELERRVKSLENSLGNTMSIIKVLKEKLGVKDPVTEIVENESNIEVSLDFRKDNFRELLTASRTQELLKPFNDKKESILNIHLGSKSFDVESAKICAEFITKCSNLKLADLSDIIAGRHEDVALEVLETLCNSCFHEKVIHVDLSENALGEKGIRKLEFSLKKLSSLESVQFFNNGLSALSIKLLCEFLPVSKLKSIQFHNNMSGDDGAKAFASFLKSCSTKTKIESLRMSSCRVSAKGGEHLVDSLSSLGESLKYLHFGDSMFSSAIAETLGEALPELKKLEYLNLKDTSLESDGVEIIIDTLSLNTCCPHLKHLDLGCLELGETKKNFFKIGKLLATRPLLEFLGLDENEAETEGISRFVTGFNQVVPPNYVSNLQILSLKLNSIGGRGGYEICKFIGDHRAVFKVFKTLELDENAFSQDALGLIKRTLLVRGLQNILGSLEENLQSDDEDEISESAVEEEYDELSDNLHTLRLSK